MSTIQQEKSEGSSLVGKECFDIDGDHDLCVSKTNDSDTSLHQYMTWRGDPDETGSDCSIIIVTNELQAVTYHVHKSIICFGPKHSKYFASVFLRNNNNNLNNNKDDNCTTASKASIKVELDQRDADKFPIFLDFMYRPNTQQDYSIKTNKGKTIPTSNTSIGAAIVANGTMETVLSSFSTPSLTSTAITTEFSTLNNKEDDIDDSSMDVTTNNAISLRFLARKFENDALTLHVNKFIQKDLNFTTGPVYLYMAHEYKDERLMESAQRLCVENITQIEMKTLIKLPINLFRIVITSLESFEDENKELSLYLSDVVCRYLEKNPKSSTAEILLELTDPLLMPYISSEAAIGYTAIVKDLEPNDATEHWKNLVRLCRRCAKAVVKEYGWSDFCVNAAVNDYLMNNDDKFVQNNTGRVDTSATSVSAARIDSLLFATSFAAALEQAQDDYDDVISSHDHFTRMIKLLNDSVAVMEKGSQRKDAFITKQQNELRNARHEIRNLKRQIHDLQNCQQAIPKQPQSHLIPARQDSLLSSSMSESQGANRETNRQILSSLEELNSVQRIHQKAQRNFQSDESPNQVHKSTESTTTSSPLTQPRQNQRTPPIQQLQQQQHYLSSPAPLARQRILNQPQVQQRQQQQYQHSSLSIQPANNKYVSDSNDTTSHRQQPKTQQNNNSNQSIVRPVSAQQQQQQVKKGCNEPSIGLCIGSQRYPTSPQHHQQQSSSSLVQRRYTDHRNDRNRYQRNQQPNNKPIGIHRKQQTTFYPDLLEMSYSEQTTTTCDDDDNGNKDDDDELLEIEMSFSTIENDLISPSQVSVNVYQQKRHTIQQQQQQQQQQEPTLLSSSMLRTKAEMRSKSLLV